MRLFSLALPVILAAILSAAPAGAQTGAQSAVAENTVIWHTPDFPPGEILSGPRKGTGYTDVFLKFFIDHTPDLDNRTEPSTMSRVFGLMQQGQRVCHPSLLKTPERESFVEFSGPVEFVLPHHLIVRADRVGKFNGYLNTNSEIEIRRLLGDNNLVASFIERRGYPPVVSDALKAVGPQKNLIWTSVDNAGLFQQLAAGWVDYLVAYPDEAKWYSDQLQQDKGVPFEYLPIAGLPDHVIGHVGCTKGDWGRRIVERVDQVVAMAGARPPWVDAEARLLDPAGLKRFEAVFAQRSPFHP